MTIGEYDMVVSEKPIAVTFDNSEFEQMTVMRKDMGIPIPDATVVRASTLADKSEIAQALQEQEGQTRSEEHTTELQSLMRISYAVFCLKKKNNKQKKKN